METPKRSHTKFLQEILHAFSFHLSVAKINQKTANEFFSFCYVFP